MGYVLTIPVEHSELVNVMVSRCGLEQMTAQERRVAVEHIRITANLMTMLIPDYIAHKRIRTR